MAKKSSIKRQLDRNKFELADTGGKLLGLIAKRLILSLANNVENAEDKKRRERRNR